MDFESFLNWLESTSPAQFVQLSDWAFPTIESVHVIAVVLVVGTIAIVDLRLIGIASRARAVTDVLKDCLSCVWIAFGFAVLSGSLMFISGAHSYAHNVPFQAKMALMLLAGVNMLVFETVVVRDVARWDVNQPSFAARISGALSLTFWIAIVAFGRWIGFTKMG
jgi:hypothetical protein